MARILINGLKSKAGGGKNILDNFIKGLSVLKGNHVYYILTPDKRIYEGYGSDGINIIDISNFYKKNVFFVFLYFHCFPKLLKKYKIDLIFNFGDVIIPSRIKQIYFFDWAYAVYNEKYIWDRMSIKDWFIRKVKVGLINMYIKRVSMTIAQTKNMTTRLKNKYNLKQITYIPTPVGAEFIANDLNRNFNLPDSEMKFLFPASFASHKNFEVLLPLGKIIKEEGLNYLIVITIEESSNVNRFINKIKAEGLENIIFNVGKVETKLMPSIYQQTDAMFLPTLLESFGLPYVEAMYYGKPIVTSNLDFAHDVCGDVADYFNPFEAKSILSAMKRLHLDKPLLEERIKMGKNKIKELPNWEEVLLKFNQNIELLLK